jgi:hypothetical protein
MRPGSLASIAAAAVVAALAVTASSPAKSPTQSATPPPTQADARAAACVKELTDAMGGQEAWDKLPYFRFDFVVVRDGKEIARFKHWWDKTRGRCRVEGPDDQGRVITAIFNLSDKKGKAFTDGIIDTDSTNIAGIIQNGYERWVNDTYWIIMPFKLRDDGTRLKHVRTHEDTNGATYDVIELSFMPNVGLTPQDKYWLYVNAKTHLIDRWEYVLTGHKPPPQGSTWESWTSIGPLQLSLARRFEGKTAMLRFENVAAPATMDESVFSHSRLTN